MAPPDERPCPDPLPAVAPAAPMTPRQALGRIGFLLERQLASPQKVRAFRRAREAVEEAGDDAVADLAARGHVRSLPGVGSSTGTVIEQALAGEVPEYLAKLEGPGQQAATAAGADLRQALQGDGHVHSTWSDGGSGVEEMARTAAALGHSWMAITDHSPRLTVAHGLSRERLAQQHDLVDALQDDLPLRLLRGMEVDILEDGSLDLDADLLADLDLVVASAHSKLRMDRSAMTERLVLAVSDPNVDVLGHCTNRKLSSSGEQPASDATPVRAGSTFDAAVVFTACRMNDVAVEVNCRPERQDPPDDLLELAVALGCTLAIHTDAHAPGQLTWQPSGCDRVAALDVDPERIVTTWSADDLVAWGRRGA